MADETLIDLAALAAVLGLMAYTVLGGADFGGGVWDLFAAGRRQAAQRQAIARAMGPVWEANHVWLIFMLVVLFTCFPHGYAVLSVALFVPFHLALVGIILRGAAFTFRNYGPGADSSRLGHAAVWGAVFGVASIISPFLLGASFGVLTAGDVRIVHGQVYLTDAHPWLGAYSVGCGLLALSACAYLAAVYLTAETDGELREDFRRRAILAGTTTAALALLVVGLARSQAPWFFKQLFSAPTRPVMGVGLVLFMAAAWAVFRRRWQLSRLLAAAQVVLVLLGWALAHRPYLIYPDMPLAAAAGPAATIRFLLCALPVGALLLVPSLILLYRVFSPGKRAA